MKKKILIILVITLLMGGCGLKLKKSKKHYRIMTSDFTAYDFTRSITKGSEAINVDMLVKPGSDLHHFKLSSKNIDDIKKSDMFIYNGSEKDPWLKDVLASIDSEKTEVIRLMDFVKVKEITFKDSDDVIDDEHIWTSPKKAKTLVKYLKREIIKTTKHIDALKLTDNTNKYLKELDDLDTDLTNLVKYASRKVIAVAGNFPFIYLTEDYGLKFYALNNICNDNKKMNEEKINELINKINEEKIPVVFYTDISDISTAERIANLTKTKALELHSAHNIAINDFDKGITYIDIMKKNIKALEEALK